MRLGVIRAFLPLRFLLLIRLSFHGSVFGALSRLRLHSTSRHRRCGDALLPLVERVRIAHGHAADGFHAFLALTRARVRTGNGDGEARNALRTIVLARLLGRRERGGGTNRDHSHFLEGSEADDADENDTGGR